MKTGDALPDIDLPATGNKTINLAALKGQPLVLYFYPRDNTPGCTQQGQDFRDLYEAFTAQNAIILGVSRDSLKSHENFSQQQAFPFDLLSDSDEKLCQLFDVMKNKNMYGKQVRGIERSTFLFDAEGILQREWRKVKVPDHVNEVLEAIKAL